MSVTLIAPARRPVRPMDDGNQQRGEEQRPGCGGGGGDVVRCGVVVGGGMPPKAWERDLIPFFCPSHAAWQVFGDSGVRRPKGRKTGRVPTIVRGATDPWQRRESEGPAPVRVTAPPPPGYASSGIPGKGVRGHQRPFLLLIAGQVGNAAVSKFKKTVRNNDCKSEYSPNYQSPEPRWCESRDTKTNEYPLPSEGVTEKKHKYLVCRRDGENAIIVRAADAVML